MLENYFYQVCNTIIVMFSGHWTYKYCVQGQRENLFFGQYKFASATKHGHYIVIVVIPTDEVSDIVIICRHPKYDLLEVTLVILKLLVNHRLDHHFVVTDPPTHLLIWDNLVGEIFRGNTKNKNIVQLT